jgi:hypothetical protein
MSMEASVEQQKPPDRSKRQHANELVRLIQKLRWIGMEEEAKQAQIELAQCGAQSADSVVAASRDTD